MADGRLGKHGLSAEGEDSVGLRAAELDGQDGGGVHSIPVAADLY